MLINAKLCTLKKKRWLYIHHKQLNLVTDWRGKGYWSYCAWKLKTFSALQPISQKSKLSSKLSLISKTFHYRDKVTSINLYEHYVRPQLEFSVPAWCPWSVGDKETIKKKFRKGRSQWFQDSLVHRTVKKHKELNLSQRLRYDTIETYKIIHGVNNVDKYVSWYIQ